MRTPTRRWRPPWVPAACCGRQRRVGVLIGQRVERQKRRLGTGAATEGRGGLISFTVGSSTSGAGSSIDAIAVLSEVNMVGTLSLGFGEGTATTGTTGASGVLGFSSGSASSGNIGAVWLGTGAAIEGRGRSISPTRAAR